MIVEAANPDVARPSPGRAPVNGKSTAVLRKRGRASFDPKNFLAKMGEGKAISKYQKDQIVFSQGAVADAVFCVLKGKIKLTVVSERARQQSSASSGPVTFSAKGVSTAIRCGSQQLPRSRSVSLRASPRRQ